MGRDDVAGRWCILRTSAARTLRLAESLQGAGFEVWTPVQTVQRRKGRERLRIDMPAPITPTFVFAPASALADLIRAQAALVSPHPPFSIMRHRDRIPLVADSSLAPLRAEEARQHHRHLKTTRRHIAPGAAIRLTEGAFAGMTGIVERGGDKDAVVNFGGGFVVTIATYLLPDDVLHTMLEPA